MDFRGWVYCVPAPRPRGDGPLSEIVAMVAFLAPPCPSGEGPSAACCRDHTGQFPRPRGGVGMQATAAMKARLHDNNLALRFRSRAAPFPARAAFSYARCLSRELAPSHAPLDKGSFSSNAVAVDPIDSLT
jgi:hypothetical protein